MTQQVLFPVAALLCGLVIGFLAAAFRNRGTRNRVEILEERLRQAHENADSMMRLQDEHHRQALDAMQQRFDQSVGRMKAELENTTAELLRRRQSEFEAASREGVSRILEPLNRNIGEMRQAVSENTLKHTEISGQLSAGIRLVLEHSDAARKSAERLADALRGGGKIPGDWGETVLTELLESQGLEEGVHFDTQATMREASGKTVRSDSDSMLRPDVVLHLDRERDVIIDAKVSLSAYLDYMNADSEPERKRALEAHVAGVERHVAELARKDYSAYIRPPKVCMNYVIMFVPNTASLYAATSHKPGLWRKAMEKGVYIADEQTLYAALKIISLTWTQIAQAENHEKVFALANEMLERVNRFAEQFAAVGVRLDDARKSYDAAMAKLQQSGRSIPVTCGKLISLGASVKPRKGVDPALLGISPLPSDNDDEPQPSASPL